MGSASKPDAYRQYLAAIEAILDIPSGLDRAQAAAAQESRRVADEQARVALTHGQRAEQIRRGSIDSYRAAAQTLAGLGLRLPGSVRPAPGMVGDADELQRMQNVQARLCDLVDRCALEAESTARVRARADQQRAAQAQAAAAALRKRQELARQDRERQAESFRLADEAEHLARQARARRRTLTSLAGAAVILILLVVLVVLL